MNNEYIYIFYSASESAEFFLEFKYHLQSILEVVVFKESC